jgi:hypothetical protein
MHKKWVITLSVLTVFLFAATIAFAGMGIRSLTTSDGTPKRVTPTPTALLASATIATSDSTIALTSASAKLPACTLPADVAKTHLRICALLSGAGSAPVLVTVTAKGLVTTVCTNKGGNVAPGQNVLNIEITGEGTFPSDENGNVNVDLTTGDPGPISAKDAGCPGANWTVTPTSIDFVSFEFVVTQKSATPIDNFYTLP